MLNQTVNSVEKKVNGAIDHARANFTESADAAMAAVKSEVNHLSRATREVASLVGAEVVKRPITYTLAAAGAGALVGVGLMALLNRPRSSTH